MKFTYRESEYLRVRFAKAAKKDPGGVVLPCYRSRKDFKKYISLKYISGKDMCINHLINKLNSINYTSHALGISLSSEDKILN